MTVELTLMRERKRRPLQLGSTRSSYSGMDSDVPREGLSHFRTSGLGG